MSGDDDDKPTVVLDLNALKKEKQKQEEELASIVQELEFAVGQDEVKASASLEKQFPVILFDFNSDFFQKEKAHFPEGFDYQIAKTLPELNKFLTTKKFQVVVFNYDINPKATNQLCAQIRLKFPLIRTLIVARAISPEKAALHAKTPSGAHGYYQLPLEPQKFLSELEKIEKTVKKVS